MEIGFPVGALLQRGIVAIFWAHGQFLPQGTRTATALRDSFVATPSNTKVALPHVEEQLQLG
jgi:hypothetical protein